MPKLTAKTLFATVCTTAGKTLDAIKARGQLICGVNTGLAGFSAADSQGNWTGLDVDVCKAIAATMLGDASKVKWVPLNAQQRFTALQSGEIDMLSRNTTWTLTRDASLGLHFTGVTYYDGQGFMVPAKKQDQERQAAQGRHGLRAVGHHHREEPDRLLSAPTTWTSSRWCSRSRKPPTSAYFAGRCQAYTTDASGLASIRNKEAKQPRRPPDPARADQQGTARPQRAPR
jgi:general L-amino acid transport system substrate-binding protein